MPSDRSHGLSEPVLALRAAARPRPAVRDRRGRRHRSAAPLPTAAPAGWRNTSIPATRPIRLTMNGRDYGCRHRAGAVPRREDGELNSARTLRCRGRGPVGAAVPVRLRPARARRVLAHLLRRPHLAVHRLRRRVRVVHPRGDPGRHLRLLRRCRGRGDPAYHRDAAEHSKHPAVDRAVGRPAPRLGHPQDLLRHHADPGAAGLPASRGWCAAS